MDNTDLNGELLNVSNLWQSVKHKESCVAARRAAASYWSRWFFGYWCWTSADTSCPRHPSREHDWFPPDKNVLRWDPLKMEELEHVRAELQIQLHLWRPWSIAGWTTWSPCVRDSCNNNHLFCCRLIYWLWFQLVTLSSPYFGLFIITYWTLYTCVLLLYYDSIQF